MGSAWYFITLNSYIFLLQTDALNKKLKEDEDSRKDRENALKYCDKQWAVQSNRALQKKRLGWRRKDGRIWKEKSQRLVHIFLVPSCDEYYENDTYFFFLFYIIYTVHQVIHKHSVLYEVDSLFDKFNKKHF